MNIKTDILQVYSFLFVVFGLMSRITGAEVCDATEDDSSTVTDNTINSSKDCSKEKEL